MPAGLRLRLVVGGLWLERLAAKHGAGLSVGYHLSLAESWPCQLGNLLACRSSTQSVWNSRWFSNRFMQAGIVCELALLASLIYTPPWRPSSA